MTLRPAILCVLCAILIASPAYADIAGKADVVDGDTIILAGQHIRLHGIDAPERGQICEAGGKPWRCGEEAKAALARLIGRAWVRCDARVTAQRHANVAVCRMVGPNGKQLNKAMVAEGWALADRNQSTDYVSDEADARSARKGLWRGGFIPPWDWRRGKRLPVEAEAGDPQCRIKGNINAHGKRIYFTRKSAFYNSVNIDPGTGERWFCTEQEAQAAGWQRSKW